jgi:hypothetical protein
MLHTISTMAFSPLGLIAVGILCLAGGFVIGRTWEA